MKCPYCKEEIRDGAIKCKHCRSMINQEDSFEANMHDGSTESTTMDQLHDANADNGKSWYFEEKGERKGPWSQEELVGFIQSGRLNYGSSIWHYGISDWVKIENSELRQYLITPPPLTGENVNNTAIWILAFAPIIGTICEFIVAYLKMPNAPDYLVIKYANENLWFITIILNVGLSYLDSIQLKKGGHDTSKFNGWVWLVPVYLFQRAKYLKQTPSYAIVWVVCFVLILFV